MKKPILPLAFLCLLFCNAFPANLHAQNIGNPPNWNWIKKFGGSGSDLGNDVARDAADNAYVTGTFNGAFKIGNNQWQSAGLNDGFLAKFAPDGSLLWASQLKPALPDGEVFGQQVALDNSGNVWVGGLFKNSNLQIGNTTLSRNGTTDFFVAKFNANGSLIWAVNYGIPASNMVLRALTADDAGNVYALGEQQLFKFNPNGTLVWMADHPAENASSSGDLEWKSGKLYLCGTFNGDIEIGNTPLSTPETALFLCEVSSADGQLSNAYKILESSSYYQDLNVNALLVSGPDEFYVAGQFRDSLFSANCPNLGADITQQKSFLAKVGTANCYWVLSESSNTSFRNIINDIALDADGNVWAGGEKNPGDLLFENTLIGGTANGFLLKVDDSNGSVLNLAESAVHKGLSPAAQGIYTTGLKGFSGLLGKWSPSGAGVFEKVFDGDGGNCVINALESDNSGVYFSANIFGRINLGNTVLDAPVNSLLIGKLSLDGSQLLWHKTIEGASGIYRYEGSNSGVLDKNNHQFYSIATFSNPISYNGQTYTPTDPQKPDYLIVQTSTSGGSGWLKVLPGLEYLNQITVDHAGNPIVCGGFLNTLSIGNTTLQSKGDVDFFVMKLNGSGTVQWVKRGGGEDIEYAAMVSTDAQNNLYLAAECYSLQLDFNDAWSLTSNEGDGNMLFLKLTPDGAPVWEKLYGGGPSFANEFRCFPYSIQTDPNGNTFIGGFFSKKNYFSNITLTSSYNFNNFIGKFDPNGEPIWMTPIKTRRISINYNEIDQDELGNIYIAGQFQDSLFVEGNVLVRQGATGANNFYFARFDGADGSLDWWKSQSGSPEAIGYPTSMSVHDHESILCGGTVIDRILFDNTSLNTASSTNGFLGLLGKTITVSVHTPAPGQALLELSPNPADVTTTLSTRTGISGPVQITLTDSRGISVMQKEFSSLISKEVIDLHNLPAGIYFLQARYGNTLETTRLVIY